MTLAIGGNGHAARSGNIPFTRPTAELKSAGWRCRKRDGTVVPFQVSKVRHALAQCFESVEMPAELRPDWIDRVTRATVNLLYRAAGPDGDLTADVEEVQRLVISQLWAQELFEAAEHYQNYREERRKLREASLVSPAHQARVAEDQAHFPTDLQYYQFASKFARWNEAENRRETWHEAVDDRVIPWFQRQPTIRGKVTEEEWQELRDGFYNLEATPALRVLQMAGPALDRCHVGVFNCSYHPLEDLFGFAELLYILMQGSGSGFSVEDEYVSELPRIKRQKKKPPETLVVPDTTEGWCDTYFEALQRWFDGRDVIIDTSEIRPAGTRLKIKGGRASGPQPYEELIEYARNLILSRQGSYLTDIDVHGLACKTGKIVQVGGVRRASSISLSSLKSQAMQHAKSGNWYEHSRHFTMANNSAVYEERPSAEVFFEEWLALVKSRSGERGIFNRDGVRRHRPKRRKNACFGLNPCGEIVLPPYSFCNLSIVVARPHDTRESLRRKVRLATIWGMLQSTCTDFRYIRPEWKKNCEDERLLGVDITGHADCPLLRYGAPGRDELLRDLGAVVKETKAAWAPRLGINESAADTTVKPSGDSAVLFDCGSGISPRYARFQVRWVRESIHSPVAAFLKDSGVPWAVAPEDPALLVFGFPKQAPAGATLRNDLTALEQFANWLEWKLNWAEHSVATTIYVEDHEWPALGAAVYDNFDQITSVAFLPKDNGNFRYSPNEELTEEQYCEMVANFPRLDWSRLVCYEREDQTEAAQTPACTGGSCAF